MKKGYSSFGSFLAEVRAAKEPLCMVIFGAPGSGKGTNARKLTEALNLLHVETGAMIRAEASSGSPLGNKVKSFMQSGKLVPNEVIYQMLEKRLASGNARNGVIFDGMPRTLEQARELDRILSKHGLKVNLVVNLVVPDRVVMDRMRKRAKLENRPDDLRKGVIENRIEIYHRESDPILNHYRNKGLLVRVGSAATPERVYRKVRRRVRMAGAKRTVKAAWSTIKKKRLK